MDATSEDLCEVTELITNQSAHINRGVVQSIDEQGASDQGCLGMHVMKQNLSRTQRTLDATGNRSPQALTRKVSKAGLDGTLPWARPDAKLGYLDARCRCQPMYADNIVIAVQHKDMIAEYGTEEAEQAWIGTSNSTHHQACCSFLIIIEGKTIVT